MATTANTTDLAAALMTAESFNGQPFASASLTVVLADGRTVRMEVEGPDSAEGDDRGEDEGGVGQGRRCPPAESLTDMQADVLRVVNAMEVGDLLKTDEIAKRAGRGNSDHLRKFLKSLPNVRVLKNGVERLPGECPEPAR